MTAIDARRCSDAYDATVNAKPCDEHDFRANTATAPSDELAIRRERKRLGQLTRSQVQRLIIAAELRKKATEGERDE